MPGTHCILPKYFYRSSCSGCVVCVHLYSKLDGLWHAFVRLRNHFPQLSGLADVLVIHWDFLFTGNLKMDFLLLFFCACVCAGMSFRTKTTSTRIFFFLVSSFLHPSASQLCLKLLCIDKSFLPPIIYSLLLFPAVNKPLKMCL